MLKEKTIAKLVDAWAEIVEVENVNEKGELEGIDKIYAEIRNELDKVQAEPTNKNWMHIQDAALSSICDGAFYGFCEGYEFALTMMGKEESTLKLDNINLTSRELKLITNFMQMTKDINEIGERLGYPTLAVDYLETIARLVMKLTPKLDNIQPEGNLLDQ